MDSTTKSRLQAILSAHESEIAREQERIDQEHLADALFAQQFAALKMNAVLPAFIDLESELKRHGHVCKIVEIAETDEINSGDGDDGDGVRCEFYPKGWDHGGGAGFAGPPSLTVSCDTISKTVKLSECTSGPLDRGWSGELGAFALEDITRDKITEAFVALVEKILLDKSYIAKQTQDLRLSWTLPRSRATATPRIGRNRRAA